MCFHLLVVKREGLSRIRGNQPQAFGNIVSVFFLAIRQGKIGKKGNVLAIGRPLRRARVSGSGQRDHLPGLRFPDPKIAAKTVMLPIGIDRGDHGRRAIGR